MILLDGSSVSQERSFSGHERTVIIESQKKNCKEPTTGKCGSVILEREAWCCDSWRLWLSLLPCASASGLACPRSYVIKCQDSAGFSENQGRGACVIAIGLGTWPCLSTKQRQDLWLNTPAAKLVQLSHKERWHQCQPENHGRTLPADNKPGWGLSLATSLLDICEACWQTLTCEGREPGQGGLFY